MMGKQKKLNIKIEHLVDSSNQFYHKLLGYKPAQTSLQQVIESEWNKFAKAKGLNPNSSGIYLPRNQTSVIQQGNPLSLFHEYFGHGFYCEQTLSGRKLVDLEKKLLEEEKREFSKGQFIIEDVQKFRAKSETFQKLDAFKQRNLVQYETFAIWTEYLLSKELGLKDEFGMKYYSLKKEDKEAVDSVIDFSEQYGNLATFYASGLARRITLERVGRLLGDIYKDKLQDVRLALLYGSRKEFSDIDVFMVGEDIPKIRNNWIDVVSCSPMEFEEKRSLFDVEMTDPLSSGEVIFGDRNYLEQQKERLAVQPITEESVRYNLQEAEEQENIAYQFSEDSDERRIALAYSETSRLTAENLRQDKRIFTKKDLCSKRALVGCDKPLQI